MPFAGRREDKNTEVNSASTEEKKNDANGGKRSRRRQRRKEVKKLVRETTQKQISVQEDLLAEVEQRKQEIAQAEKEAKLKENKVKTGLTLLYPQHPQLHQIEYIPEPTLSESSPYYDEFKAIFQKFATPQELAAPKKTI